MQKSIMLAMSALAALGLAAAPASAKPRKWHKPMREAAAAEQMPKAEVVERDAKGHATKVSIDGKEYAVCSATVTDSCIQPRAAGLNWGNTPIDYWPGKPASEIPGKLPVTKPDAS